MNIKGLEKLGEVDEAGAAELAAQRAEEEKRLGWLLRCAMVMVSKRSLRGGAPVGHIAGKKKALRRKKVSAARKADRGRRRG